MCVTQVVFEEFKEADSTTGQANHRVSRGLHNKVLTVIPEFLLLSLKNLRGMLVLWLLYHCVCDVFLPV